MADPYASLNGNIVTHARLSIPAWGVAWHDVTIDGEIALSGAVTLVVADLTIQGTILAGGPGTGRSFFRVVSGAGGWGKPLPKKAYSNDLGVKLITVLQDAASACGETLDTTTIDPQARIGPYFARVDGEPAARVLEQLAPGAWYVGEDGKTRLGARPAAVLADGATRTSQLDLARGTLTLASETIATILPGLQVDGLTAVDVEHEIDTKKGLRSKIWGQQGAGTSRRLSAIREILEQLDPDRRFRGLSEYRIVTQDGERLNLQAVRVSTGMPDLSRVMVRPGMAGLKASHTLGARVLVGFADADPARPAVLAFEDAEGAGWQPSALFLAAGGKSPTEHVITAEAACLMMYNFVAALLAAQITGGGGPMTAAGLQPLLAAAMETALTTVATPAPPGVAAQITAAAAEAGLFTAGTVATTAAPFIAGIVAALAAKTDDVSGLFPSVGAPKVQTG